MSIFLYDAISNIYVAFGKQYRLSLFRK